MGGITQALRNASSGLLANQQALNSVANNISNVNTVGYSRKIINFENVSVAGRPSGVQLSEITRQIDEGLLKTLRLENSELQTSAAKVDYYERLQDLFGSPGDNETVSHLLEKLAESSELLALAPDKSLEAADFVRSAVDVTIELQQMSKMIQELRLQADAEIASVIKEMNEITNQIDTLNDDIISYGTVGRDVTDMKDQRDLQIDRLSTFIDIRYFSRSDGDTVVYTSNGSTLVDTVPPKLTHTPVSAMTATSTHKSGNISGIFVGTDDITTGIRAGNLKALVDMRDEILPNLQSQIDELAVKLRDSVNQIHNQGMPFPGSQSMTGSRIFIAPSTQTIKIDSANTTEDVKLILFDTNGDQTASTTLKTLLESASYGTGAQTPNAATSITEVAASIQEWLNENASTSATANINTNGKFEINLNTTTMNLAFRDEKTATNGSDATNASVEFDSNGDGVTDETNLGFSNFFGLNDFFVDNMSENLYETDVLPSNFSTTSATLSFRDNNGLMGGATLTVAAGTRLADLATSISTNVAGVTASIVPDGAGERLRITHDDGASMTITQSAGDTLLTTVNLHVGDVGVSANMNVRADIVSTPTLVTTGQPIWDSARSAGGEYYMSIGDDTIAQLMAIDFSSTNDFSLAGGLPNIANSFSQYAAGIIADNASLANVNERNTASKRSLKDALQFKSDSARGVNIDEEMADLIVFEQAFAAAARVISVISDMMETLEDAVR